MRKFLFFGLVILSMPVMASSGFQETLIGGKIKLTLYTAFGIPGDCWVYNANVENVYSKKGIHFNFIQNIETIYDITGQPTGYEINPFRRIGTADLYSNDFQKILVAYIKEQGNRDDAALWAAHDYTIANNITQFIKDHKGEPVRNSSNNSPQQLSQYNRGGYGPAGGTVFYDKGVYSEGWRYMEAAPSETEFESWDGDYAIINGTSDSTGSGRRNTQIIAEILNNIRKDNVAQAALQFSYHGYRDWFIPSKDELNLVYGNLIRNNIGNFHAEYYLCSSWIFIPYQTEYLGNDGVSQWLTTEDGEYDYWYERGGGDPVRKVRLIRYF